MKTGYFVLFLAAASALQAQPSPPAIMPLDELKPGQHGEVWTVFRGTEPESFSVEVTGVVRNALGPGKSLILCHLTDPRVQEMGAVAGMSGSPLYIDGRLAGALSYKIQLFEKTPYAGFTPAADLAEVGRKMTADETPMAGTGRVAAGSLLLPASGFEAMRPVFTMGGLDPTVASLMGPYLSALGLKFSALGGSDAAGQASDPSKAEGRPALRPGNAVSVALATGDITLAGTGTVSEVNGSQIIAFGHPMIGLGNIELPMCSADIVTILPSALESVKVANTGPVIGTITEDRLSAVSGTLGRLPSMIQVEIHVDSPRSAPRTLHFQVARQQQLTPAIVAAGVTEAIVGSNDSGLSNGFRIDSDVFYSGRQTLAAQTLYAGPQAFAQGLGEFIQGLSQDLQNPYEKTFPERVSFEVRPLEENPAVTLERFELSRSTVRAGDVVEAELAWRNFQGAARHQTVEIPIDAKWSGKSLEVIVAPGRVLDELTGRSRQVMAAQLRSFDAYLAAMREDRPTDGLCIAVIEKAAIFSDQAQTTPELPGSLARIASSADEARFQQKPAMLPLWERHLLTGKLANAAARRALQVVE